MFSSDYDGNDIKVVLNSTSLLREPYSLAVFGDRLFYPDTDHGGVISVNKVRVLLFQTKSSCQLRIPILCDQPPSIVKCNRLTDFPVQRIRPDLVEVQCETSLRSEDLSQCHSARLSK